MYRCDSLMRPLMIMFDAASDVDDNDDDAIDVYRCFDHFTSLAERWYR